MTPTRGSILDVGCATGGFLLVAKQHGWQVSGVEISEYALARANRLLGKETVIREIGNLEQGASFDAISLWAFIEHIPDPESLFTNFTKSSNREAYWLFRPPTRVRYRNAFSVSDGGITSRLNT